MDTQQQKQENSPLATAPKRSKFWKFVAWFVIVIVGAVVLLWGIGWYEYWRGERDVEKIAEAFKKAEEESYARAMADTYGGKTPQETLRMYIDAVEKGDYELASKYFIEVYQERELKSLQNSPKENISNMVRLLKKGLFNPGSFSFDKNEYIIENPIFVDFKLYPNGIWKIVEI